MHHKSGFDAERYRQLLAALQGETCMSELWFVIGTCIIIYCHGSSCRAHCHSFASRMVLDTDFGIDFTALGTFLSFDYV